MYNAPQTLIIFSFSYMTYCNIVLNIFHLCMKRFIINFINVLGYMNVLLY
jgi:hypothetical protein